MAPDRIIPLEQRHIDHPTKMELACIEVLMLWPDDAKQRALAMRCVVAQFGATMAAKGAVAPDEIGKLIALAAGAPRGAEIAAGIGTRMDDGLRAGAILFDALALAAVEPEQAGMARVMGSHAKVIGGRQHTKSKAIYNRVWTPFRPVAPLWAAYMNRARETGCHTFPCRLADFAVFLAAAEAFRRRAETVRSEHAKPILGPGEAWHLRPEIIVPQLKIDFVRTG
jgi:hypothetical protein